MVVVEEEVLRPILNSGWPSLTLYRTEDNLKGGTRFITIFSAAEKDSWKPLYRAPNK